MKKVLSVLLAVLVLACAASLPALAADDGLMEKLQGSYIELFPEFAREEYHDYWLECIGAYVDDGDAADMFYTLLTQTCMGELKGEEAIQAYADTPEVQFDCFFENGLAVLTVEGDTISGTDADGEELFRHDYAFAEDVPITYMGEVLEGMVMHVYKTEDGDAGDFTYFGFTDDTPDETQHIEFRYGPSLEDMSGYTEGLYAYWLAAGIPEGYDDGLIRDCIKLFVDENMAEEAEAAAEVIEISTPEELAAINENLSASYVLTADIDLGGEAWTPIGTYAPSGESPEEQEIPDLSLAFTGSFDGGGHTISNLVIDEPESMAMGLFGCAANADIRNFTLENASVDGMLMSADVVGYAFCTTVADVYLWDGHVTAHPCEMSDEGMFGGIVGAGMMSLITDCSAEAEIILPDGTANAGVVGGGLEMTSVVNCVSSGSVTAGDGCYGLGGVSGCGFGAEEFTGCRAEDVSITAGDDCYWIGGITGYAGGFEDETAGVPVTVLTDCTVKNVTVVTGEDADGVDDIVGAGFYSDEAAELMGAPFDQPTVFELVNCGVEE